MSKNFVKQEKRRIEAASFGKGMLFNKGLSEWMNLAQPLVLGQLLKADK